MVFDDYVIDGVGITNHPLETGRLFARAVTVFCIGPGRCAMLTTTAPDMLKGGFSLSLYNRGQERPHWIFFDA